MCARVFDIICSDAVLAEDALQEGIRSRLVLTRYGRIATTVEVRRVFVRHLFAAFVLLVPSIMRVAAQQDASDGQ